MSDFDDILTIKLVSRKTGPVAIVNGYTELTAHELEKLVAHINTYAKELRKQSDLQARRARGGFGG